MNDLVKWKPEVSAFRWKASFKGLHQVLLVPLPPPTWWCDQFLTLYNLCPLSLWSVSAGGKWSLQRRSGDYFRCNPENGLVPVRSLQSLLRQRNTSECHRETNDNDSENWTALLTFDLKPLCPSLSAVHLYWTCFQLLDPEPRTAASKYHWMPTRPVASWSCDWLEEKLIDWKSCFEATEVHFSCQVALVLQVSLVLNYSCIVLALVAAVFISTDLLLWNPANSTPLKVQ